MTLEQLWHNLKEGGMPIADLTNMSQDIKDYVSHLKAQVKAWEEEAKRHSKNATFYQGVVNKIGTHFGDAAKRSDDGSLKEDVLALNVEPLVVQLKERIHRYEEAVATLPQSYQDDVIDAMAKGM